MKADRRKIEIIMARQEKKRAELSISSSTMYNILAERDVKPHTLGKLARRTWSRCHGHSEGGNVK